MTFWSVSKNPKKLTMTRLQSTRWSPPTDDVDGGNRSILVMTTEDEGIRRTRWDWICEFHNKYVFISPPLPVGFSSPITFLGGGHTEKKIWLLWRIKRGLGGQEGRRCQYYERWTGKVWGHWIRSHTLPHTIRIFCCLSILNDKTTVK
jgi:hypothetical protein